MRVTAVTGFCVLAAVWLWLAYVVLSSGGVTLVSLLTVAMSGIMVFVPLSRKYLSREKNKKK